MFCSINEDELKKYFSVFGYVIENKFENNLLIF
jgi:hypothetical protein